MIVQFIGYCRRTGTSRKSGNDYDFVQVHFIKDNPDFTGRETAVKNVRPSFKYADLIPNQHYDFDFDDNGNLVAARPAKS